MRCFGRRQKKKKENETKNKRLRFGVIHIKIHLMSERRIRRQRPCLGRHSKSTNASSLTKTMSPPSVPAPALTEFYVSPEVSRIFRHLSPTWPRDRQHRSFVSRNAAERQPGRPNHRSEHVPHDPDKMSHHIHHCKPLAPRNATPLPQWPLLSDTDMDFETCSECGSHLSQKSTAR